MITQKFDISKKPLMVSDNTAYFVDSRNVHLHRQYVKMYYGNHELNWFDKMAMTRINSNKSCKLIFYYHKDSIGFDDISLNPNTKVLKAFRNNFTIYYITNNALITVE